MEHLKRFCFILIVAIAFSSCVNYISDGEEEEVTTKLLTISIDNIEQLPFTRAEVTAAKRISYVLYTDGAKTQEVEQTSEMQNFGSVTLHIPYGNHQLFVVAHNGTEKATIGNDIIAIFGDRVTDTFHSYQNIEVSKTSTKTKNITLKRDVCKFEILHTDAIPEGMQSMVFEWTGGGNQLNGVTGYATSAVAQRKVVNVPQNLIGSTGNKFVLYSFLTETVGAMNITATAVDAKGETMFQEIFSNVPMKINRITRYTGRFFKTSDDVLGDITIDSAWEDDVVVEF